MSSASNITVDNAGTSRRNLWFGIALLIVVLAAYGNTLLNGFVMDDATVIIGNSLVKQGVGAIPELLTTPRLSGYLPLPSDSYRPVPMVLFAIEYSLWGNNPMMFHLMSLLLFAGCTLLLYRLLRRILSPGQEITAFAAALLFAVHPIHTEVVANIKSADELLAFLLGFTALHLYLDFAENGRIMKLIAGATCFFLACMSKESVITFVGIVPILFFAYKNENKRRSLFVSVVTVVGAGLYLILARVILASHDAALPGADDFTTNALLHAPDMSVRMATAVSVLGRYLQLLFIPHPLLCNYSYSSVSFASWGDAGVWGATIAYAGLAGYAVFSLVKGKKDMLAFAILFFLGSIALFSNIPFLITSQMAERFLFFPSAGFCIAVALLLHRAQLKLGDKTGRRVMIIAGMVVIPVFTGLTIARNSDWKDNDTLFSADVLKAPQDCKLNYFKATSIPVPEGAGQQELTRVYREKLGYLQAALAIYPDFAEAHTESAKILEYFGEYDAALAHNIAVLRDNRKNSIATFHAGIEYYALRKYPNAIEWLRATVQLSPEFTPASLNLAKCFDDSGLPDSAIVYYRKTLALTPDQVLARRGIALAFLATRQFDSADYHMQQVTVSKTSTIDDLNNLGVISMSSGRYDQALARFRKVIALDPGYKAAYGNMAAIYDAMGLKDSALVARGMMATGTSR
ncbi:MAG: tetratricopeptide repeat protein [Taibaiella sp.]|nr:tetratricopeptide repeat protein [Taibaiella sp.]